MPHFAFSISANLKWREIDLTHEFPICHHDLANALERLSLNVWVFARNQLQRLVFATETALEMQIRTAMESLTKKKGGGYK